jgi:hypothetical protein
MSHELNQRLSDRIRYYQYEKEGKENGEREAGRRMKTQRNQSY